MRRHTLSRRLLILSGALFSGALGCVVAFNLIGSKVDEDGVLREPFVLVPISAVLLLGSSASLAGAGVAQLKRRP